jgi:hypothetical protein
MAILKSDLPSHVVLHTLIHGRTLRAHEEGIQRLLASNEQLHGELGSQFRSLARHVGAGLANLSLKLDEGFADLSRKLESPNELLAAEYYRNAVAAAKRELIPEAIELVNKALVGDGLKSTGHALAWQFHWLRGRLLLSDEAASAGLGDPGAAERAFRQCARLARSESKPDAALAYYFAGQAIETASAQRGVEPDNAELLSCYSAALAEDETLLDAVFEEARVRLRMGDRPLAFEGLSRIARAQPSFLLQAADTVEFMTDAAELQSFLIRFRNGVVEDLLREVTPLYESNREIIEQFPALWQGGVADHWRQIAAGTARDGAVSAAAYYRDSLEEDIKTFNDSVETIARLRDVIRQTESELGDLSSEVTEVLDYWARLPSLPLAELLAYAQEQPASGALILADSEVEPQTVAPPPADPFAWLVAYAVASPVPRTLEGDMIVFALPNRLVLDGQQHWNVTDSLGRSSTVCPTFSFETMAWTFGNGAVKVSAPVTPGTAAAVAWVLVRRTGARSENGGMFRGDPIDWTYDVLAAFCNALSVHGGLEPAYLPGRLLPDAKRNGYRLPIINELADLFPEPDWSASRKNMCHALDGRLTHWIQRPMLFPFGRVAGDTEKVYLRLVSTAVAAGGPPTLREIPARFIEALTLRRRGGNRSDVKLNRGCVGFLINFHVKLGALILLFILLGMLVSAFG